MTIEMTDFLKGYIIAALWSTPDENEVPEGDMLDARYGIEDIAPECLQAMAQTCADFQNANKSDLDQFCRRYQPRGDYSVEECAGHDFWFTRNHHGVGFWDRGLGELGDRLTKAAHVYGEVNLYPGDDGKIYGETL
jgi:hypothetical protein